MGLAMERYEQEAKVGCVIYNRPLCDAAGFVRKGGIKNPARWLSCNARDISLFYYSGSGLEVALDLYDI